MCKYCKRLKELNERDSQTLMRLIRKWRRKSELQDKLLAHAMRSLEAVLSVGRFYTDDDTVQKVITASDICDDIQFYLERDVFRKKRR